MSIKGLSALNEELSGAPALQIEVLTSEELSAVAGGLMEADSLEGDCTCGTRSVCHIDGTTDSD
jgi:hypothetical protein